MLISRLGTVTECIWCLSPLELFCFLLELYFVLFNKLVSFPRKKVKTNSKIIELISQHKIPRRGEPPVVLSAVGASHSSTACRAYFTPKDRRQQKRHLPRWDNLSRQYLIGKEHASRLVKLPYRDPGRDFGSWADREVRSGPSPFLSYSGQPGM